VTIDSRTPRLRTSGLRLQGAAARHPLVLVAIGVVLYSTGPVFVAAATASGAVLSFWRLWLGVPVLGLAALLQHRGSAGRSTGTLSRRGRTIALWAGVAFGGHQLAFMTAVQATSVTDVALMNTLAPIVVAIAAVPLFGERTGAGFRLWTGLAMLGAGVVVLGASTGADGDPVGMLLAALNVVCFGAFFLLSKLSRDEIDVLPFLLVTVTVAALAISAFLLLTGADVTAVTRTDLWYAFAIAAGPGAMGHFIMTWPLRWVPANVPPVMKLGQPVIAGGLAWVFLAQSVTVAHLVGGALTVAGVCGALLSARGLGGSPAHTAPR
jgi:drug/metabolite transporter (DMT)-like permease